MGYWKHGRKTIQRDGAPCVVYNWYEDDAEYLEAIKPRDTFKAAYYENGYRMVIDGTPIKLAAHVRDWSRWMKAALCKGTVSKQELCEASIQMAALCGDKSYNCRDWPSHKLWKFAKKYGVKLLYNNEEVWPKGD